jgi:hypothetical protein
MSDTDEVLVSDDNVVSIGTEWFLKELDPDARFH